METPSNFAKYIFHFNRLSNSFTKTPWSFEGMARGLPII
jgi:hypothetical protein